MSKVIDSEGNIKVTGLGSVISQVITDGVVDKAPSENAVFDALATKLDINALPSNLVLYPTNVASDISGYFKMVTSQDDPSYNVTAIDFVTPAITTTSQLVGSVATTVGVLSGNPGTLPNVGTIGNIKRNSGSGNATFYFEVYHRNLAGTETLIGTSNQTTSVTSSSYVEFEAFVIWNNGTFLPTDRIVIKYLANRVGSGSDPVYSFQFGGLTPTRTIVPVPASVLLNVPIQVGVTQIVDGTNGRVIYDDNGVIGEVEVDSTPTLLSANLVSSGGVATSLANKQNTLVSGTNIKTINGNSLLGSGDLVISGGGGTPAGTSGQIQFNSASAFAADSNLFWDNTNKRLGIGTASPTSSIDTTGNITTNGAAGTSSFGTGQIISNSLGNSIGSGFYSQVGTGTGTFGGFGVGYGTTIKWLLGISKNVTDTTSLTFLEDGLAGSRRLTIAAGGNIGVGSSIPLAKLQTFSTNQLSQMTLGSTNGVGLTVSNTDNYYGLNFGTAVSGDGWIQQGTTTGGATAYNLSLQASGGRVGIGAISPQARLDVRAQGALSTDIAFRVRNSADSANILTVQGDGDITLFRPTSIFSAPMKIFGPGGSTIAQFQHETFGSVALGLGATFDFQTFTNVVIGSGANTTGGSSAVAIGGNVRAGSTETISIGNTSKCVGAYGIKIGSHQGPSTFGGTNSIHLGRTTSGNNVAPDNVFMTYFDSQSSSTLTRSNGSFGLLGQQAYILGNGTGIYGTDTFMGNGGNTLVVRNHASIPSTNVADSFQQYSADIVAGNAAPHFRTENGDIIKLYKQSSAGITTVADLVTVLTNLGLLA